jgi:hypothetical protein
VKVHEFGAASPILVLQLCGLKDHVIVGSALPIRSFLIVDFIEQIHLLIVGGPVIF